MAKSSYKTALKHWVAIPADARRRMLDNVWCPDCSEPVTICDFAMEMAGKDVVLRGFCATCGHKVARVIEGAGSRRKS